MSALAAAVARPPSPAGALPWPVWRLSAVVVLGAFASGLDASLVNVALDSIRSDLQASLATTQWVSTGYLIALAVSLPLAGWLGERFGAGRVWLLALAAFTAASLLCALSPTVELLITARVLQGLAGGVLIPAGQTVLGQAVGPERLGRVIATLGIAVTLAPALGPVIGGLILHWANWPWLFALNLPIGVLGIALGRVYIPLGRPERSSPLDSLGLVLLSAGLPLGVYGITELTGASRGGAQRRAAAALVSGVLLLACYVLHSRSHSHPVLRLALLRRPTFSTAVVASGFTGMLLFGTGLIFPLYFQLLHHDSTVETGLRLLSVGGGTALALPVCGRMVDRWSAGPIAVAGSALCLLSTGLLILLPTSTSEPIVQAVFLLFGIAVAFAAVPPTIAAYKAVPAHDLPQATTQVNIAQRLGGALGGALFTVLMAQALQHGNTFLAFRTAFACIATACFLSLLSTAAMVAVERRTLAPVPDGKPHAVHRPRVSGSGYDD